MNRSELTGIILAGGKSSRMGRAKGLVEFRGKPLIQYAIDLLLKYTDRILISSGNADYQAFGLELVPDDITGQGPAAGLAASLRCSNTLWNLVVACDLPFLETKLIDCLLESPANYQAVVPVHKGVNEPLAALYHKDLAGIFEAAVSSGNLTLHKILASCKVKYFHIASLMEKYPKLFTNFNSLKEMNPYQETYK